MIKNIEVKSASGQTTSKSATSQFSHQYSQLVTALKSLPVFESGQFKLTSIDELNTYDSSIEFKCVVFALIRKDPSRILEFLLEDPTGKVPVSFHPDHTTFREWATLENGIYLVEGTYDAQRDSLLVKSIGLPPPINSMLPSTSNDDETLTTSISVVKDSMVIILADIHLDNPKTFEGLKFLFAGYSQVEQVPEVFVLIGNFTSTPVDQFDLKGMYQFWSLMMII